MRTESALELSSTVHEQLTQHLLGKRDGNEQAAFAFAEYDPEDHGFTVVDWYPVPSEGFVVQLPYHFELTDETRAHVIKRAHDLAASIIEFHSHTGGGLAQFSPSDWSGFEEIVPHVWWRLKGRPYAAVVVSRSGFDAFAWLADPNTPTRLGAMKVEGRILLPTGVSPLERSGYDWKI
jgi:hypothetical protein